MQKPGMQNRRPSYPIEAVDNALRLIQLLRDEGSVRLTDASKRLGIAPSSAHRLLAMLTYRGFAVRDEEKRYLPGPAMRATPVGQQWTARFRQAAQPHVEELSVVTSETVNLMVRIGAQVRIISSVEGIHPLRVGDRQGAVLPALSASGGKAMLAHLPRDVLDRLLLGPASHADGDGMTPDAYEHFLAELQAIRRNGYAINAEETEEGVRAVGAAVHNGAGEVLGAIAISIPTSRFQRTIDEGLISQLLTGRDSLDLAVRAFDPSE
jgi:DNA-binding IclR family transcriptional regulator